MTYKQIADVLIRVLSELCGIETRKTVSLLDFLDMVLSELCGIETFRLILLILLLLKFCLNYVG